MMDLNKLKAPFPKDRVSWRAQTVTKTGDKALALAYIDARDVMERLDEVCGPAGWQCRYTHADKKTVCEIGVFCSYEATLGGEWVWKSDGAGDSDVEAEKGALSDAFKRAAVRWGVGRYLYDLETPWVPCESRDANGKKQFVRFTDDPWKHVKGQKAASTKDEPKESPVDLWIAKAKAKVLGMESQDEITEWSSGDQYINAVNKMMNDHPEKHRAFTKWMRDQYNGKAGKAA